MSAVETGQQTEQRSSVKVTMNAKHDPQWEIKIVDGATEDEINRLRTLAVEQHRALVTELLGRGLTT